MGKRGEVLEMAVLGLLQEHPMHGYELRKGLTAILGWGRALSYGSLYPCLGRMLRAGWIAEDDTAGHPRTGRRGRIVYRLTPLGRDHFEEFLADTGPTTWEDEAFGVHLAFFARTDAAVRLRILEGRRRRLEDRLERVQAAMHRARERLDTYNLELQRHGLESVEREVRWLNDLIDTERVGDRVSGVGGERQRAGRGGNEEPTRDGLPGGEAGTAGGGERPASPDR